MAYNFSARVVQAPGGLQNTAAKCYPEDRGESKAKRKRTSPHDQTALEAQYRRNPKPNKMTRSKIVEEISLNEKEVQVWFQNRRQIDRRKSRPLLLHDTGAMSIGGATLLSTESTALLSTSSSQTSHCGVTESGCSLQDHSENIDENYKVQPVGSKLRPPAVYPFTNSNSMSEKITKACEQMSTSSCIDYPHISTTSTPGYPSSCSSSRLYTYSTPPSSQLTSLSCSSPISSNKDRRLAPIQDDERNKLGLDTSFSCRDRPNPSTIGYSAKENLYLSQKCKTIGTPLPSLTPRSSCSNSVSEGFFLKKSSKRLRTGQNSPTSGANRRENCEQTTLSIRRRPVGRSRSARAWKFCCDRKPHDELTLQAENESHGSAVAAISLIRSTERFLSKSNKNYQIAPELQGKTGQKRKTTRTMREVAAPTEFETCQSFCSDSDMNYTQQKVVDLLRSPSCESDKENWSPYHCSSKCRRQLPSSPSGNTCLSLKILGGNFCKPLHAKNLMSQNCDRKLFRAITTEDKDGLIPRTIKVAENLHPEMGSGKYGDLGAIQGLLSLSQGNWR